MIYLFTVAASPRLGTKLYSRLLTTQQSYCYHQLTALLHPYPSNWTLKDVGFPPQADDHNFEQAQRCGVLECYPDYYARLWERAQFGEHIIGNSDPGALDILPGLWMLWPEMKIIFSKRNGVSRVQSSFVHRAHFPKMEFARYETTFQTSDFFAQCCHLWVEGVKLMNQSKQWLRGEALCLEASLGALTSDIGEIKRIWDWLGIGQWDGYEERNRQVMATLANAGTNGRAVAGWEKIWDGWTPEQRAAVRDICGETQRSHGYLLRAIEAPGAARPWHARLAGR